LEYAVEIGSVATIHILIFMKIDFSIQPFIRGDTQRARRLHKPTLGKKAKNEMWRDGENPNDSV
jgi:hypothetical protein